MRCVCVLSSYIDQNHIRIILYVPVDNSIFVPNIHPDTGCAIALTLMARSQWNELRDQKESQTIAVLSTGV